MFRNPKCVALLALLLLPALIVIVGSGSRAHAQQYNRLIDLRGGWRFEIGDDPRWAEPSFNDAGWVTLRVPGQWEEQGFPGYDGYAWYRKSVNIPKEWLQKQLYLDLGVIDDVDEVYVNGQFMGFRGQFPPDYRTAYNEFRFYYLPAYCLRPGESNVIAVRVYDSELGGGIVRGEPAIKELSHSLAIDQPLPMTWKFKIGDDMAWRASQFDDGNWERIRVPAFWETQGHKGYDGFGWYRVKFRLNPELTGQHLILFLGKIDDIDEAYLNGERIGKTGTRYTPNGNEYRRWRAYTIPNDMLLADRENVLAVRVYDGFAHGGIYEGPIGIVRREKYLEWVPHQERPTGRQNGLQRFLEWLFE
jgi:Glycosyl hydrolases family 2, sugar binding domain